LIVHYQMKISSDDQKAISVILICLGFLFFLIGLAAHLKESFHSRAEITTAGFVAAAIFAGLGVLVLLFSFTKKQS
jgi:Kef-type K+ transport system membrane component KefB